MLAVPQRIKDVAIYDNRSTLGVFDALPCKGKNAHELGRDERGLHIVHREISRETDFHSIRQRVELYRGINRCDPTVVVTPLGTLGAAIEDVPVTRVTLLLREQVGTSGNKDVVPPFHMRIGDRRHRHAVSTVRLPVRARGAFADVPLAVDKEIVSVDDTLRVEPTSGPGRRCCPPAQGYRGCFERTGPAPPCRTRRCR